MKKSTQFLPPPNLPQMTEYYTISKNDIDVGGGVFVRIRPYENAREGDFINVMWDGISTREILIKDPSVDFPVVFVITSSLELGKHEIFYFVQDKAGNTLSSEIVNLNIIEGMPDVIYAPPVFIDASNGVITQQSIEMNNGTNIMVYPYSNIAINDMVTLFWTGYDENSESVKSYVETMKVTTGNINTGLLYHISIDNFTNLYGGECSAFYQVSNNLSILGISDDARVSISGGIIPTELDMIITTGAAIYDPSAIDVSPFNQGVLKGKPGVAITLSLVGEGAVFEASGTATHTVILDEYGQNTFKIRASRTGGYIVNAYEIEHPNVTISRTTDFGPYEVGNGKINYINNTTGAPADGITPCSFYLKTAASLRDIITVVRVNVSGSAIIDGYGTNKADITLHSDHSAEINIINTRSGEVDVELSLPESSGSINRKEISFINF